MNYIKHQIYLQFSSYQKKLLPDSFEYLNPTSLQDRSKQSTKATLFHLHTCEFDTTQTCPLISANQKHDFSTISKIIFKNSYIRFPVTSKMDIDGDDTKPRIIHPTLNCEIFDKNQKHEASFKIPTPIPLFNELADKAEKEFMSLNNSITNIKWRTYYFYTYFKAFLSAASRNDSISELSQHDAIIKVTQNPIDTHYLARILTFYYISHQNPISLPQIHSKYKTTFYPQAQQIIYDKFKINFKQPKSIQQFLLFNPHTTQDSSSLQQEDNLTEATIESTSNSPKLSYAEITTQNF